MTPQVRPLLQRLVDAMERRLKAYGQGKDRYGLIHADFRLANLLIHNGNTRVIDSTIAASAGFLYDAGTAVSFFEQSPKCRS
jgi:Ser/Thr protein kinase RdoA (MazF antagonist)